MEIADVFTWVIIILFILAFIFAPAKKSKGKSAKKESKYKKIISDSECYDPYYVSKYRKLIGLSARKGYQKFDLMGVYYRDLSLSMVGKFNGYACAETNNEYDPFAIAIYNDDGVHLGYLPRETKWLHSYILDEGGKVHAYGYLAYADGMYGETCVEVDKRLVRRRNLPYPSSI